MKQTEIHNSGILGSYNGQWKQTVTFTNEKNEKFRITINDGDYKTILYKWSDSHGWLFIVEKSSKSDYNIDVAYQDRPRVKDNVYDPIIKDLKKFSENF
jgi:hypothetical protein